MTCSVLIKISDDFKGLTVIIIEASSNQYNFEKLHPIKDGYFSFNQFRGIQRYDPIKSKSNV